MKNMKSSRFLVSLASAYIIGLGINHYLTHPELMVRRNESGNIVYVHPDEETNHILNFFAGRDSISHKEALDNFKGMLKIISKSAKIKLPEEFDDYNITQVDSLLTFMNETGHEDKHGIESLFYEYYNLNHTYTKNKSKKIYDLIWRLEQECGNPKIRFLTEKPSFFLNPIPMANPTDPYFSKLENTLYLRMVKDDIEGCEGLLAELAHGKQLKKNPFRYYLKRLTSNARILLKGRFNVERLYQARIEEYEIPGSLEYEAHSIIEPKLREKYRDLAEIKVVLGERIK